MMIKIMILFLATQTANTAPTSGGDTVPGTYPPLPRKYWVPVRRPAPQASPKNTGRSDTQERRESQGASYEESPVDLLTPEERVTVMGGGRLRTGMPEFHVVQPGETLWDISSRYYGDPWEWPKLWAMNPHVTNPHWLFPGTRIYLTHRRSPGNNQPKLPVAGARPADHFVGLRLSDVDESIRNLAVVEGDATKAGTIEGSVDGRMLIARGDRVYVKNLHREYASVGTRLGIYRVMGPVTEPATGRRLGVLVCIRGEGRIVKKTGSRAVLEVTDSIAAIEKGDFVGPVPHRFLDVRITRPPARKIHATVSRGFLAKTMFSSGDLIVLSAGRQDGVAVGMPFLVAVRGRGGYSGNILPMEQGKATVSKGEAYPWEVEARGIVLYTHDHISIGIIRRTYLPVRLGDDVLMGPWEGVR